jgi:hypothetical protein
MGQMNLKVKSLSTVTSSVLISDNTLLSLLSVENVELKLVFLGVKSPTHCN